MEKAKIRPVTMQKPLNQSSQNFGMRDYVMEAPDMQKFVASV